MESPCECGILPPGSISHRVIWYFVLREDNFRMGLKEICVNTKNWVDFAQDREYWRALVNAALNLHGVSIRFLWEVNVRVDLREIGTNTRN